MIASIHLLSDDDGRMRFALRGGGIERRVLVDCSNVVAADQAQTVEWAALLALETVERNARSLLLHCDGDVELSLVPIRRTMALDLVRKDCRWRREDTVSGCAATIDGHVEPADASTCRRCDVPDTRLLCSEYANPIVTMVRTPGAPRSTDRESVSATCARGNVPTDCAPGGAACWMRRVRIDEQDGAEIG